MITKILHFGFQAIIIWMNSIMIVVCNNELMFQPHYPLLCARIDFSRCGPFKLISFSVSVWITYSLILWLIKFLFVLFLVAHRQTNRPRVSTYYQWTDLLSYVYFSKVTFSSLISFARLCWPSNGNSSPLQFHRRIHHVMSIRSLMLENHGSAVHLLRPC